MLEVNKMNELLNAIENGTLYDYISNNYYDLNKYQLRTIILELLWALRIDEDALKEAMESIKEELGA